MYLMMSPIDATFLLTDFLTKMSTVVTGSSGMSNASTPGVVSAPDVASVKGNPLDAPVTVNEGGNALSGVTEGKA